MTGGKLCGECRGLAEIEELKRVIKERVFDVSGEGENTMTMENVGGYGQFEMSFNKEEKSNWKSKTTKIVQTRG